MTRFPDDPVSIARRAGLPDNLAAFMPRFIHVESGGNPNAVTGSYSGLLQMGPAEMKQYGGNSLESGVRMYVDRAREFARQNNGRAPTPTELYLINQQGPAGLANHMKNPGGAAWQNMYSTGEGQRKGPLWAKAAIWGNIPNDQKAQLGLTPSPHKVGLNNPEFLRDVQSGALDKVSSNNFLDVWHQKIERVPIPPRPPVDVANAPGGANDVAFDPITGEKLAGTGSGAPVASTGAVAAAMTGAPSANYPPARNPGYRLPMTQAVANPQDGSPASVPLPWRRPAGAGPDAAGNMPPQGPTEAQMAGAPAGGGGAAGTPLQSLGQRILQAFAPGAAGMVPPGASSYVDPNTGHTIVNPGGSGELAMGLTRDVGAAPPAARPAPAPETRPAVSPPPASSAGGVSPSEPVPPTRATVPDILAPLMTSPERNPSIQPPTPEIPDITERLMSRNTMPDILAPLGGGGTGGGRLPLAPRWMSEAPTTDARLQKPVVDPTMFDVKRTANQRAPLGGPVPVAPDAAGLLASPSPGAVDARLSAGQNSPLDRMLAPPDISPAPDAIAPLSGLPSGGQNVPSIPMTQPVTVSQQLGGLSPFATNQPVSMEMPPTQQQQEQLLSRFAVNPGETGFASTTLLPFQQWPPVGFDTAGWGSPASFNFGDFG